MKILLVTEAWDMQSGPYETLYPNFHQFFTRLGHKVSVVDNKKNYLPLGGQTMWDYPAHLRRLRWGNWNNKIVNWRLRQVAQRYQPDLVLVTKGENITSQTIQWLQHRTPAVIINWDHDNPFWHVNTTIEMLRSIALYDCFGAWAKFIFPVLYSIGCKRVEHLPMFFNVERFKLKTEISTADRSRLGCDIAFIGNGSAERAEMLRHLTDFNLGIWGHWDLLPSNDPLRRHWRGLYLDGENYTKALLCTKIAINVMNLQCKYASNTRTFEATGVGRLLLTEYTREQAEDLFIEDREITCFRSAEELRYKAAYYLEHESEREQIAQAGQARTLQEHTLEHRLGRILQVAEEIWQQRQMTGLKAPQPDSF